MTREQVVRALEQWFAADAHGAAAVYLFGSVARDTARADSDVDVGVLFAKPPAPTLEGQPFDLAEALERLVGGPVDVVVLNTAPPTCGSASCATASWSSTETPPPACASRSPRAMKRSTSSRCSGSTGGRGRPHDRCKCPGARP